MVKLVSSPNHCSNVCYKQAASHWIAYTDIAEKWSNIYTIGYLMNSCKDEATAHWITLKF